jgi:hypothetical protein
MQASVPYRAALASVVIAGLAGSVSASMVGYRFHGVVDGLNATGGTAYSGVAVNDAAWIDVYFDPTAGPAMTSGSTYAFDYDIPSLAMEVGGVTPGAAQSISGTTLWGFTDAVSSGNDSLAHYGSFTTGETLLLSIVFSGPSVFTVPGMGTPTMPTDLDTQTMITSWAFVSLGSGSWVSLDITSIEFFPTSRGVPAPGGAALAAGALFATSGRRRR